MVSLLQQFKSRRLALKLKQNDMLLRIGISRQQYQRLESKGNPRLNTLELVAEGLDSELLLIPKEKLAAVQTILKQNGSQPEHLLFEEDNSQPRISDNPWEGLGLDQLEDE